MRSATTAAPLQRVYKVEGFLRRLTITVYDYVKTSEIRADSKLATNQNGLQCVEHYALKYDAASVKSENYIFCYTSFFAICLLIFIFPVSLSLPFFHPFCRSFIFFCYVLFLSFISLYSIFHASFPSVYLSFVYLNVLRSLRFLHFYFCLLHHVSPFSLFSVFACLFTQGASLHTKQLCIPLMYKIDHFKYKGITCGHNLCFS